MKALVALAVGYFVGVRTGGKDLEQLNRTLKALCKTDEFADVVSAARSHVGSVLRDIANIVDEREGSPEIEGDLVAKVRHLVGRA